jgi:hypothetical protein
MADTAELTAETAESSAPSQGGFPHLVRTQRTLQVILGLFWLLDAALQFQPYMFGQGFVKSFILVSAQGQPAPVAWFITNVGHFISPDVAVWNAFFALIQVFIGAGLLFRRTVRPALAVSFAWVLGVWFFGEGLGGIFTGTASALTGAPGSVLIYGLLGLMAWPRTAPTAATTDDDDDDDDAVSADVPARDNEPEGVASEGVASSAAGRGIGGGITPLAVWSGYWVLAAVLFLLPDNRAPTSISSAITSMAPGSPERFAHFLTSVGQHLGSTGNASAWVLAIASLVIGLGPLVVRRPGAFLVAGGVLAGILWILGQGWIGGIFTGSGTDPNTGPLIIVLALAMVPARAATRSSSVPPITSVVRAVPGLAYGGAAAIAAILVLSATYPVPAQGPSNTSMPGMNMSASGTTTPTTSTSASATTCNAHQKGLGLSGLDLNNTPYMVMGGHDLGMDMNGADASAAAGLNTTKSNWHYTGPALPSATAAVLLADGGNGPDDIHMAVSGCAKAVTATQLLGATEFVQSTSQAAGSYATPAEAEAAGYVAASPADYPVVTYVNPAIVAANATAQRTLNPGSIDGLVYATIPSGQTVLAAAMYILPSTVSSPPMPYGAMVQWHQRTDLCGPPTSSASSQYDVTGAAPCAAGTVQKSTPYTTMVWQVPVAGGPLAIQPPDIQIVEAAVMAAA